MNVSIEINNVDPLYSSFRLYEERVNNTRREECARDKVNLKEEKEKKI